MGLAGVGNADLSFAVSCTAVFLPSPTLLQVYEPESPWVNLNHEPRGRNCCIKAWKLANERRTLKFWADYTMQCRLGFQPGCFPSHRPKTKTQHEVELSWNSVLPSDYRHAARSNELTWAVAGPLRRANAGALIRRIGFGGGGVDYTIITIKNPPK